ncbi:LytTR family DNA-binding domain-containing protein [Flaviaesturariibacter amylovorans]|uniref:LytTR family DNA-binding domain-containing protein n=1 Tax=Flaviaesturariibacter amylovorans TaxID=1084520 RepID=A0ABP8GH93_9BACT
MNILIVEDEPLLRRRLQSLLEDLDPEARVTGHTGSVQQTVEWLQRNEAPDLIFLDIELGDGRAFDILERHPVTSPLIFVTAYDEFAVRAFRVNSLDYLLKPVRREELAAALGKFRQWQRSREAVAGLQDQLEALLHSLQPARPRTRFLVRRGQKMRSVEVADVAYIMVHNSLQYIVTRDNQRFLIDHSIDDLERELDGQRFFRANRQVILAHDIIANVQPEPHSKLRVEVTVPFDGPIMISRNRAKEFREWMGA